MHTVLAAESHRNLLQLLIRHRIEVYALNVGTLRFVRKDGVFGETEFS
jgi:hypothetical protein